MPGHRGCRFDIRGEHGADPAPIHSRHAVGLDYVSCSPFRVPFARLAATQAKLAAESQTVDAGTA